MVDRFRLLKKAFIANKQGLKEFGSDSASQQAAEEEGRKQEPKTKSSPTVENFFSFQKGKSKTSTPRNYEGFKMPSLPSLRSGGPSPSSKGSTTVGVYILLLIIAIIGLIIKNFVAYTPAISLFISIILGLFFFMAIHYTPEAKLKESLVFLTFALDTFTQFMLGFFPESELKKWLITYYVFAWVILAVILFLMGVTDALGSGERIGKAGWLGIAVILGAALFFIFPMIVDGPSIFQDTTHAQYFNLAKAQVAKVAGTLEETKNFWYDYFGCSTEVFSGSLNYDHCMEGKRITRYCNNNFVSATEQKDCIKQQQDLIAQGAKPGVAGSVSDAIKQVTKIEFKEDQYFPRKATEVRMLYPITLKVDNPRQQIFLAKLSCEFKGYAAKGEEKIPGVISIEGQQISEIQINGKQQQLLVGCQPSADLKGKYTLDYTALLSGMQTFSFLKRAFVSKDIDAPFRTQIETDNFKTKDKISQGPAEFALLNFKFGSGDGSQPLIVAGQPVSFSFAVEDVGNGAYKGEIVKVNNYNFHGLWERGFNIDQERIGDKDCLQGGEIFITPAQTKKREPSELKRCFLQLPSDLQTLTKNQFKVETFVADLNYDYQITRSITLEVTPLETSTGTSNSTPTAAGLNP